MDDDADAGAVEEEEDEDEDACGCKGGVPFTTLGCGTGDGVSLPVELSCCSSDDGSGAVCDAEAGAAPHSMPMPGAPMLRDTLPASSSESSR